MPAPSLFSDKCSIDGCHNRVGECEDGFVGVHHLG